MPQQEYVCSYRHNSSEWGLTIFADDEMDAQRKLHSIGQTGRVDGVAVMKIPAIVGWWIPLIVWLRNFWAVKEPKM